eukprot:393665_1
MSDDNKNEKQQWFYFFDRSFKYIVRIGKLIQPLLWKRGEPQLTEQEQRHNDLYITHIGVEMADTELKRIYRARGNEAPSNEDFAAFNWYTLARLWLEKNAEKKTIRGDVEKG